jgi:hypothetical protein
MLRPTFRKSKRSTLATALGAASLLFAAMFAPQSRATTFIHPGFTVSTTPDLSNLFATEGSGQCNPTGIFAGCLSLSIGFLVTNTSIVPVGFGGSDVAPTFVAGNPSDNFVDHSIFGCFASVPGGGSCGFSVEYRTKDLTTTPDFDGDFAVFSAQVSIASTIGPNNPLVISYQMTIFDPIQTPLPTALPLFASGLVGLVLLGWRRKQKAIAA